MQVGLPPHPVVGYSGQQIGSRGLAEQDGVVIDQEIFRGGKLRLNRAVVAQEVNQAQQELAVQQQRVLTDVRIAFYQVLVAQRQIDLTAALVVIGNPGTSVAASLLKAQEVSKTDVLQARIEVENALILAENAQNRHKAAWQTLAAVVGDLTLPPQALAGDAFANPRENQQKRMQDARHFAIVLCRYSAGKTAFPNTANGCQDSRRKTIVD